MTTIHKYSEFAQLGSAMAPFFREAADNISFTRDGQASITCTDMSTEAKLALTGGTRQVDAHSVYLIARAAEGPKVFRPKQIHCEALENTKTNFTLDDYSQPFPTVIVELPQDYTQKKVVADAAGIDGDHAPVFMMIHQKPFGLICGLVMSSGQILTRFLQNDGRLVEEMLGGGLEDDPETDNPLPTNDAEAGVTAQCLRLAINFCQFVMQNDYQKVGPDEPKRYERLRQLANEAKKQHNGRARRRWNEKLRNLPLVYELDQKVRLYSIQSVGISGEGGRSPK